MNKVKMVFVKSSQIKSVGYDSEKQVLYIEFLKGTVYEYYNVPATTYNALLVPTMSVGKYFFAEIKGKFAYKKTEYTVLFGTLHEEEIEG
jgi:hypothetical protein